MSVANIDQFKLCVFNIEAAEIITCSNRIQIQLLCQLVFLTDCEMSYLRAELIEWRLSICLNFFDDKVNCNMSVYLDSVYRF